MPLRRQLRIFAPVYVLMAGIAGGIVLAVEIGGGFESFFTGSALPLLLTTWMGAGFTAAWDYVGESARFEGVSPYVVAAVGVLGAGLLFMMLGGPAALGDDPWLFGAAIWPGLRLAVPLVRALAGGRGAPRQGER